MVDSLATTTYYQLLDLDPSADNTALSEAYRAALRSYHPDRYATESDPLRVQALTRLLARINEGYRVLSRAELREAYDRSLPGGATRLTESEAGGRRYRETRDPMTEAARNLYDRGCAFLDRGDLGAARAQLALALKFENASPAIRAAFDRVTELAADKSKNGKEK